jgi:drug/metabolite transporter (DMT)-like permease
MYESLVLVQLLKSANPYFRKHVLGTLDSHDFLFINAMLIFLFSCFYILYLYLNEPKTILKTMNNFGKLDTYQYLSILFITIVTTISAIYFFEFDKNYNTPLMNHMYLKIVSVIILLLLGVFIFKEKYTYLQLLGFLLAIIGLYLIFNKGNHLP